MALQKGIVFDSGLETTAYYKIESINVNYTNKVFNIVVGIYLNKDARDAGKSPLQIQHYNAYSGREPGPPDLPSPGFDDYFSCSVMDTDGNIVHQAYKFLKTLSEFTGAADI